MTSFLPISVNVPLFWPKLEFSFFLIGQILSIPCYLFVFYHILFNKIARQALHNHSILILLFYNFLNITIDLSLTQNYTRLGYVTPFSPALCLIWQYVDYGIWYGGVSLMLWTSFERHILVFHPYLVRSARGRLLFHYIPLVISALYAPILFFYLIFLLPCDRIYNINNIRCGSICFYSIIPYWFNLYDSFVNYTIPILLIVIFSLTVVLRFIKQKQRLQRAVAWHQCRKMVIQLSLVSATYLIFDLPFVIIFLVRKLGYTTFANNVLSPFITRLTLVPAIVLPYATLLALPGLKQKLNVLWFLKRNRQIIAPTTINH